jgi:hypothetical protein
MYGAMNDTSWKGLQQALHEEWLNIFLPHIRTANAQLHYTLILAGVEMAL